MKEPISRFLERKGIQVLFEDDQILVLNKPAPYLVLPDRFDEHLPCLYSLLNDLYGKIYVVHRLENETTGVILFAKNPEAHANLSEQFTLHTVRKSYHAIIVGTLGSPNGPIDLPVSEGRKGKMRVEYGSGKNTETEYTVLEGFQGFAFIEVTPKTGRTQQIHIHLSALGTPILCDMEYGGGEAFYLSSIKLNFKLSDEEEHPMIKRTALHAVSLTVTHPSTGEQHTFSAPLPKDMATTLKYLRKFRG